MIIQKNIKRGISRKIPIGLEIKNNKSLVKKNKILNQHNLAKVVSRVVTKSRNLVNVHTMIQIIT
jgi:hypothetical protein